MTLDRVQERRRAAALARHYRDEEGLSIAEIARRLGRARATVKAYLYDPADANKRPTTPQERPSGRLLIMQGGRSCKQLDRLSLRPHGRRSRLPDLSETGTVNDGSARQMTTGLRW